MNSFRILTRATRPATQTAFFTSSCAAQSSSSTTTARNAARKMSGAEELLRTHGMTVFKGLALAGVGGVLVSKFMTSTAHAEAPAKGEQVAGKKIFGRAGPVFTTLSLQSSEKVNHNTKLLRFALPNENDISGLPLTSALLTIAFPNGSMLPVLRPYTPVSSSTHPGTVELLVKRYPDGKQSTHLHSLSAGDRVLFGVVIPGYAWTPNRHDSVTLVAGGAGVTPCYQLARGVLENPEDRTRVRLVFGVNAAEDVLLRSELEALEARHGRDRFRVVYAVAESAPKEGDEDKFRKGYVTEALLREVAFPESEKNTKIMVCGPPAMEEALLGKKGWVGRGEGILSRLGYRKDQIHQF